jgi:uncharacterized protein YqgC (DUF456 family)
MDIILTILAIGLLLGGLAGAVLPIPGPPLSLAGMFCLHYTRFVEFNKSTLVVFTVLTVAMAIFDYYAPVWGTKKFGGSKYGAIGSTIGLLVGMFFIPAVGMLLGAFLGASWRTYQWGRFLKSVESCYWFVYRAYYGYGRKNCLMSCHVTLVRLCPW